VAALIDKVNLLKDKGLTGVCVATHWLARRVQPLKKQVHPGWEYIGSQDSTQQTQEKNNPRASDKASGGNVSRYLQMAIDPSYQRKDKKASRKPLGGIKISNPKPKAPASTPPSEIQKGIPIL
jgi:hypothetical protein